MNEFEFYFSFYGLLLGLSAATLVIRFADVLGEHGKRRIGWLAPLLGIFVLLDLSSFWIWAWRARAFFEITYMQMYVGLVIAVAYFISASSVFPREGSDWQSLDDHYWDRKKVIILGLTAANAMVIAHAAFARPEVFDRDFIFLSAAYWPPLLALLFTKRSMIDLTLLSWLCIHYVAGAIILRW
jgi:hypothetical protein